MKKYDWRRIAKEHEDAPKRGNNHYIVVRTNQQDPPIAECRDARSAQMIADALNASG